jgi:hypothetical protein
VIRRASAKCAAGDSAVRDGLEILSRILLGVGAIIALGVAACKDSAWTPMGSAELVLSDIKVRGAPGVSKRLDDDESFGRSVMKGIETGDSLWLRVAAEITPPSATAEASLAIALASALPRSPARVLALIGDKYPLEEVCGIPFLRPDSSLVETYHDSTVAALARVRDSTLTRTRDRCQAALDTARVYKLARINPAYIIKNKPTPAKRR